MNLEERILSFSKLGQYLLNMNDNELAQKINAAENQNAWFTKKNIKQAIDAWIIQLRKKNLDAWISSYNINFQVKPKTVLILMAGNIPLVGFHDLLSVLILGYRAIIKPSSSDNILIPFLCKKLMEITPDLMKLISFTDDIKKKQFDAVIATGSDCSVKYFEYYFKNTKKIIRKNRTSVAILDGTESKEDLEGLSKDVFAYFGLGCRNVSKLFLPKGYDVNKLFKLFYSYKNIIKHKKYANNYFYNKSIFLMENHKIIDNRFLLMKEDKSLQSPLAMLYYEYYDDKTRVDNFIKENQEEIQCVVSRLDIPFGNSQSPKLWHYADGVDIIKFLLEI